MSRIDGWPCRLLGDISGPIYPMVRVDEQSEAEYILYGDLVELKTFIFHDGSRAGRNQANAIARMLAESKQAVRELGIPGIVAIFPSVRHTVLERRQLQACV